MKLILSFIFSITIGSAFSQKSSKIFTTYIDNFWVAYDSIQHTNEYPQKLSLINSLYIHKGAKGLKAFLIDVYHFNFL